MITRGELHPEPKVNNKPTLDRGEVEALRNRRAAVAVAQAERRVANERTPPDDGNTWLSVDRAADLLGITRQAVNVRARKEQIPSVMKGGRRWIRRDQLEMVERTHAVSRGEEPPAWTWSS